jgi:hypothetical protein
MRAKDLVKQIKTCPLDGSDYSQMGFLWYEMICDEATWFILNNIC